jgi:hypothetical protein
VATFGGVALFTGLRTPVSAVEVAPLPEIDEELDAVDLIIAETMARNHGLPLEEAKRRTVEQNEFDAIADAIWQRVGIDSWAGSWIDQDGDGALVVQVVEGTSKADRATIDSLTEGKNVRIMQVQYSYGYLERLREQVLAVLGSEVRQSVSLNQQSNSVVVKFTDSAAIDGLVLRFSGEPVEFVVDENPVVPIACNNTYAVCDPPLRGGIDIAAAFPGRLRSCTGGFVTRAPDNVLYMLTAGHCPEQAVPGAAWVTAPATSSSYPTPGAEFIWIGTAHPRPGWQNPWLHNASHDIAMIRFTTGQTVSETRVFVDSSLSPNPTTRNEWYDIAGVGNAVSFPNGSYMCYTGWNWGTECAKKTGVNGNFIDLETANGNWPGPCSGDSGGPLYKNNLGYGIMVGTQLTVTSDQFSSISGWEFANPCAYGNGWDIVAYRLSVALSTTNTSLM